MASSVAFSVTSVTPNETSVRMLVLAEPTSIHHLYYVSNCLRSAQIIEEIIAAKLLLVAAILTQRGIWLEPAQFYWYTSDTCELLVSALHSLN